MNIYQNIKVKRVLGETSSVNTEREFRVECCLVDIFVNCNWVDSRLQQNSTHLHTNNTQNNKMKQNTQTETYIIIRIH